jgi:thiol-disulfide isomerase/thioredoxin
MNWISYFSFLLFFLNTSCAEQAPLSGKIEVAPDSEWASVVYLIQPPSLDDVAASYTGQVLDSVKLQLDGSFAFEHLPDAPEPIMLQLAVQRKGEPYPNRLDNEDPLQSNYFPIIWKNGERIVVSASANPFQRSLTVQNPSPENAALLRLRDIRLQAFQQFLNKQSSESHDETQLLEEEAARLNFQRSLIAFADTTAHLLPALVALRWVSPENDYERVPEFLVRQCEKWQEQQAAQPWVVQLCQKSSRAALPVLKGSSIPDLPLPMLSGDTVALHQQLAPQLTLLDLWASWCAPCRRENKEVLLPLWEKYHEQGFQIIGYALESSDRSWKRAIEQDGADLWLHASHLRGDDAPLMQALRLQTIPANFLIDKTGKVLAKNLHGSELVDFVEQYLD